MAQQKEGNITLKAGGSHTTHSAQPHQTPGLILSSPARRPGDHPREQTSPQGGSSLSFLHPLPHIDSKIRLGRLRYPLCLRQNKYTLKNK